MECEIAIKDQEQQKPPTVGDLVVHQHDQNRGINCAGLVLECRGQECFVLWASAAASGGWYRRILLRVIKEAKPIDESSY